MNLEKIHYTSELMDDEIKVDIIESFVNDDASNILDMDGYGEHFIGCGEFKGTLQNHNLSSVQGKDILVVYGSNRSASKVFSIPVLGDATCHKIVIHTSNQSYIFGHFDGNISFGNQSYQSVDDAALVLKVDHQRGIVLNHAIVDGGFVDRFYGGTIVQNQYIYAVGQTKGNLSTISNNSTSFNCSNACGTLIKFNLGLEMVAFNYTYGSQSSVIYDVAAEGQTSSVTVTGYFQGDLNFNNASINANPTQGETDVFIAKFDSNLDQWKLGKSFGGGGSDKPSKIIYSAPKFYLSARISHHQSTPVEFDSTSSNSVTVGGYDFLLLKISTSLEIQDHMILGSEGDDWAGGLATDAKGQVWFTGAVGGNVTINGTNVGVDNSDQFFLAAYNFSTQEIVHVLSSGGNPDDSGGKGNDVIRYSNKSVMIGGRLIATSTTIDTESAQGYAMTGILALFEPDLDNDGIADHHDNCVSTHNTDQTNLDNDLFGDPCDSDRDGDNVLNLDDYCPESNQSMLLGGDFDGDGCFDIEDLDDDNDGVYDNLDSCPEGVIGNMILSMASDRDQDGCHDTNGGESPYGEDNDDDSDDVSDWDDNCTGPNSVVNNGQFEWVDNDNDGCHDVRGGFLDDGEDDNDDNDDFLDEIDRCPNQAGTATIPSSRIGCIDSDGDEIADTNDDCLHVYGTSFQDRSGCLDSDMDGYSDPDTGWSEIEGADVFIFDDSQWRDTDQDGYGDLQDGRKGDSCPNAFGTSKGGLYGDRWGCTDSDGDGWSDARDAFANDQTQWNDTDADGYGDVRSGTTGDACPNAPGTSKGGLYGDRWGCVDSDGDGWSDARDAFIEDQTQWNDTDADGYGDERSGTTGDSCPNVSGDSKGENEGDRWGCIDSDGDGWSDETDTWSVIQGADAFLNDATQWRDTDGDGYGDNWDDESWDSSNRPGNLITQANEPDYCPNENGTSQYDGHKGCKDEDQDGFADELDDDPCPKNQKNTCINAFFHSNRGAPTDLAKAHLPTMVILVIVVLFPLVLFRKDKPEKA